jgi:N-acetylneuraminic acid mutarotase
MTTPREAPHLVLLGDGRVLAVGNDAREGFDQYAFCRAREDSVAAEVWDPATGRWTATASLATPRAYNVALSLADGRTLVTGGANGGPKDSDEWSLGGYQSYSSTWIFDPRTDSWTNSGLLGMARTDAVAATLPDGRVLVAGGFFADYFRWSEYPNLLAETRRGYVQCPRPQGDAGADVVAAAWYPGGPLADVAPEPPPGRLLGSAELYDPVTGRWSATGSLAVARHGGSAVTLADGRVLVAGQSRFPDSFFYRVWAEDDRVDRVAEVYDPATGRFRVTGGYPTEVNGTVLVALRDGGALLIGGQGESAPTAILRYDPGTNRWSSAGNLATGRKLPAVALLPDGKVLVAGGEDTYGPALTAEIYDPETETSSPAPSMPEPRAGGAAVVLVDGSVLIAGGYGRHTSMAVRFVPGR